MIQSRVARDLTRIGSALLALTLVMTGCGNNGGRVDGTAAVADSIPSPPVDPAADASTAAYRARVDEMLRTAPPGLDACTVVRHVHRALDTIARWPRPLLSGDDGCVLSMLDTLVEAYARTTDARYLVALDTCMAYADGYVAEYFETIASTLFQRTTAGLVQYLYEHRAGRAPLQEPLIWAWRRHVEERPDSVPRKRELADSMRRTVAASSLSPAGRSYFESIIRDAGLP